MISTTARIGEMAAETLAEVFGVTPEIAAEGRRLRGYGSAQHRARQSERRKKAWEAIALCPCGVRHRDESIRERCPQIARKKIVKNEHPKIIVRGGNFDSHGALLALTGAA